MLNYGGNVRARLGVPMKRRRLAKAAGLLAVCLVALAWIGSAGAAISAIDPILLAEANSSPAQSEQMIIVSTNSVSGATDAFNQASAVDDGYGAGTLRKELPLVGGVAVTLPAARVATLAQIEGITVSLDAALAASSYENLPNIQLWPYLSGNAHLWAGQHRAVAADADRCRDRLGRRHERPGPGEQLARSAGGSVQPGA